MEETVYDQLTKPQFKIIKGKWWHHEQRWKTVATSFPPEMEALLDFLVESLKSRKATVVRYMVMDCLFDIFGKDEGQGRQMQATPDKWMEIIGATTPEKREHFRKEVRDRVFKRDLLDYSNQHRSKELNDSTR